MNQTDKGGRLNELLTDIPTAHGNLKKEGPTSLCGPCPFCGGGIDRFVYKTDSKKWWCRSCHPEDKPGDKIEFHSLLQGLDFSGLVKKYLKNSITESGKKIVAVYDYKDAEGKLICQTVRYEPKEFKQRRPDGKGGWIWNLKEIETVLYHLPEVIKAQEVFLVEGEKDADNLSALGFTATTNPMGAGKWKPQYNESLRGKDAVLIPHNDSPGKKHMEKVASELSGVAASIKIIDLPDLPEKGDVSDFISTFSDKTEASERLSILVEGAPLYVPAEVNEPARITLKDVILPINHFCKLDIPELQTLLHPFIKRQSIGMISAARGVGKSLVAKSIGKAVVNKEKFGSWECNEAVPVCYLDAEMTIQDDLERVKGLGLDNIDSDMFYLYCDAYASQLGLPRANLLNEKWRCEYKAFLLDKGIKLHFLDNIASLTPGIDENSKMEWDEANQWLIELRFADISTVLIHHTGKSGSQRGTSAREDNLDYSISLKRPADYSPTDGARFILSFTKARVSTKYLSLIADTEFMLREIDGKYEWTFNNVKQSQKEAVLKLCDEGLDQKAIGEALGLSKGYVSKIKNQAIKDGLLSKTGKLTQSGFMAVIND